MVDVNTTMKTFLQFHNEVMLWRANEALGNPQNVQGTNQPNPPTTPPNPVAPQARPGAAPQVDGQQWYASLKAYLEKGGYTPQDMKQHGIRTEIDDNQNAMVLIFPMGGEKTYQDTPEGGIQAAKDVSKYIGQMRANRGGNEQPWNAKGEYFS